MSTAEFDSFGTDFSALPASEQRSADVAISLPADALVEVAAENAADLIHVKDLEGRYVYCNRATAKFVNRSVDEVIGSDDTALFGEAAGAKMRQNDRHVLRHRHPYMVEETVGSGTASRILHASKSVLCDSRGEAIGVVSVCRDISDRKRTDAALRAGENRYRSIIQLSPDMIFIVRDEVIRFINKAGIALLGARSAYEIIGRSLYDFFADGSRERIRDRVRELQQSPGEAPAGEGQLVAAGGEVIDVEVQAMSFLNDGGLEIQVICRDVRERKKAEAALREAKAFADTLIESVTGLFFLLDQDGYLVRWNQVLQDLFEISAEQMRRTHALDYVHPDDKERLGAKMMEAFSQGRAAAETRFVAPSGTRNMALSARRLEIDGNVYLVGSGADITDLKQAEDEVRQLNQTLSERVRERTAALTAANEQLQKVSQAKSEFLATMSHELRTPLNGILGMNELLLAGELTGTQRQYVEAGDASGRLLKQLIDDILDLAKIESGKFELDETECDIEMLIRDVAKTMSFTAGRKGLALTCDLDPAAAVRATCDDNRLRQVLVNLIGNAIKFTTSGGVTLKSRLSESPDGGSLLRVSVIDTGIGIPQERLSRLFTAFSQVDNSTTRRYGGTGLGLSICRRLIGLMGGQIGVKSRVGLGSTFWFEIPLQSLRTAIPEHCPLPTVPRKTAAPMPQFDCRVLVAEDNSINQLYIRELLKLYGCRCDVVSNGEEAVAAFESSRYDLVLMDVQMPEMDGYAASREIRRREAEAGDGLRLPIIALTANALASDRDRCLEAGMDDFITKPLEGERLRTLLGEIIGEPA